MIATATKPKAESDRRRIIQGCPCFWQSIESYRQPQAGATVAIVDQGSGMDPDFIRNRLFQPFASTKEGGFGVGAFEARSLVAAMGGRLTVESRPGKGSQFIITLPATAPALETHRKSA